MRTSKVTNGKANTVLEVYKDLKSINTFQRLNLLNYSETNLMLLIAEQTKKSKAATNISYDEGVNSLRIEKDKVSIRLFIAHLIMIADCFKVDKEREVLKELQNKYRNKYFKRD